MNIIHLHEKKETASELNIYNDDTIFMIKKKIINHFNKNHSQKKSINEIYLFTELSQNLNDNIIIDLFEKFSTESIMLTNNINILNKNLNLNLPMEQSMTFESFKKAFNKINNIKIKKTIGQQLSFKGNYQYITNPYQFSLDNKISRSDDNIVLTQDKFLLFKYGNNIQNIYYVFADEVLEKVSNEDLQFYILKLYFPKLFKDDNIKSLEDLKDKQPKINDKLNDNLMKLINFYHKDHAMEKNIKSHISTIQLTIHPESNIFIPLDVIFKLISSSKDMPLIKFSPKSNIEDIYRLYVGNNINESGNKIPTIITDNKYSKKVIRKVSFKKLNTINTVGFYITINDKRIKEEIFCEIHDNGNIIINIKLKKDNTDIIYIESLIKKSLNDKIITPLNSFLNISGYSFPLFKSLYDKNIEVNSINFMITNLKVPLKLDINKFSNCLSNVFTIREGEFTKDTDILKLIFKKVSSYNEMNDIESFITIQERKGKSAATIRDLLMDNFNITKDKAVDYYTNWSREVEVQTDAFSNKKIHILNNPGFDVDIKVVRKAGKEKEMVINYNDINDVNYIKFLKKYSKILIMIINDDMNDTVKEMCKKKVKEEKIEEINQITIEEVVEEMNEDNEQQQNEVNRLMDSDEEASSDGEEISEDESSSDSESDSSDSDIDDSFMSGGMMGQKQQEGQLYPQDPVKEGHNFVPGKLVTWQDGEDIMTGRIVEGPIAMSEDNPLLENHIEDPEEGVAHWVWKVITLDDYGNEEEVLVFDREIEPVMEPVDQGEGKQQHGGMESSDTGSNSEITGIMTQQPQFVPINELVENEYYKFQSLTVNFTTFQQSMDTHTHMKFTQTESNMNYFTSPNGSVISMPSNNTFFAGSLQKCDCYLCTNRGRTPSFGGGKICKMVGGNRSYYPTGKVIKAIKNIPDEKLIIIQSNRKRKRPQKGGRIPIKHVEGIKEEEEDPATHIPDDANVPFQLETAFQEMGFPFADLERAGFLTPEWINEDSDVISDIEEEEEEDEAGYDLSLQPDEGINGGAKKRNLGISLSGKNNFILNKLRNSIPDYILKENVPGFLAYARACPSNVRRVPILLSKKEIEKLGGITKKTLKSKIGEVKADVVNNYVINTIPEEDGGYSYMCPRFWCFKENKPLTMEELEAGECGGIDKLAPIRSSTGKLLKEMPKDKNIFEFTDATYHKYQGDPFAEKDSDEYKKWRNNYIQYYPGVLKKNSKDKEPPCCVIKDVFIKQKLKKKKIRKVDWETSHAPLKKSGLLKEGSLGYIPDSLQFFLKYPNELCYDTSNGVRNQNLKKGKWCLLRLGISSSSEEEDDSFIKSINNLINDNNYTTNLKKYFDVEKKQDFYDQKDIIREKIKKISLVKFLIANKGNLYEIFSDRIYDRRETKAMILQYYYRQKRDWKKFSEDDKQFISHLRRRGKKTEIMKIIKARKNFVDYILNGKNINFEYLWDLICLPKEKGGLIFKNGINMLIFNDPIDDVNNKIEVICPRIGNTTEDYVFKKDVPTIMLYSKNNKYQPLVLVKSLKEYNKYKVKKHFKDFQLFGNQTELIIKDIIRMIKKECNVLPSMPEKYEYSMNITLEELKEQLYKKDIRIEKQIINDFYKVIGVITKEDSIYIPIYPSPIDKEMNYEFFYSDFMNNAIKMDEIIQGLKNLDIKLKYKKDDKDVKLNIKSILVMNDIGIGLISNTNQLIITLPENNWNIIRDEYKLDVRIDNKQDYEIDRTVMRESHLKDDERIETLKKIKLEKVLYKNFRNAFKIYINDNVNEMKLKEIKNILEKNHDGEKMLNYFDKYEKMEEMIDEFIEKNISWTINDYNIYYKLLNEELKKEENIHKDFDSIVLEDDEGKLYLNKKNMITGGDNQKIYKHKLLNELIKYKVIQKYLLSRNLLINFDKLEYKISKQEIILLESSLIKGIPEWINNKNIELEEWIKNMNIFDNYNTSTGKENYTDNYNLKISKNVEEEEEEEDDFDIYDLGDETVKSVEKKKKKERKKTIITDKKQGYRNDKVTIKSDTYRKSYYRLNKNSFRYDEYIKEWMNGKREELSYITIDEDKMLDLIFRMKKGNEELKKNIEFLMNTNKKKQNEERVYRLIPKKEDGLKGRDWLDYINNIAEGKFEDYKIVKKFIEYYEKYNLKNLGGKIVGIKMKDRPVTKDPRFMLKEWKMMFNKFSYEEDFLEESKQFIEYNNNMK